ncbi:MAG TPA: Arm DNA-binding domain-containing protein [Rhizomicrobium sp.]|nr:Arm DNA-binding domain-containing protein [Rhizomicrobium sp.]
MRLTDIVVRNLKVPQKGAVIFSDDVLSGFGVRVSEGGTKSFVLIHGARRTRETIGRVGVISLAEARAEAKLRLARYTLGKDKPKAISWTDAKDEYLAERESKLRPRTLQSYSYFLNRIFRYGPTKLTEINHRVPVGHGKRPLNGFLARWKKVHAPRSGGNRVPGSSAQNIGWWLLKMKAALDRKKYQEFNLLELAKAITFIWLHGGRQFVLLN